MSWCKDHVTHLGTLDTTTGGHTTTLEAHTTSIGALETHAANTTTAHFGQDLAATATPTFAGVNLGSNVSVEDVANYRTMTIAADDAAIAAGALHTIPWDISTLGTLGTFSDTNHTWTCPANGFYAMELHVEEDAPLDGLGDRVLGFYNATKYELDHQMASAVTTGTPSYSTQFTGRIAADTVYTCVVQHNAGAALTVGGGAGASSWNIIRIVPIHTV